MDKNFTNKHNFQFIEHVHIYIYKVWTWMDKNFTNKHNFQFIFPVL